MRPQAGYGLLQWVLAMVKYYEAMKMAPRLWAPGRMSFNFG